MTTIERDLTTARGLYTEQKRLGDLAGRHVSIGVCSIGAEVYIQSGKTTGTPDYKFFRAETFEEAITEAETHIAALRVLHQNTVTRRMALAIIEITDEHTRCTEALLRGKGFIQADIDTYRDAACERASEMCANTPFSVEAA